MPEEPPQQQGEKPKESPLDAAYRAYLQCVKAFWSNLDVEALDLMQLPPGFGFPAFPHTCTPCGGQVSAHAAARPSAPGGWILWACTPCQILGTVGTLGTAGGCFGTLGTANCQGLATLGTAGTMGMGGWLSGPGGPAGFRGT